MLEKYASTNKIRLKKEACSKEKVMQAHDLSLAGKEHITLKMQIYIYEDNIEKWVKKHKRELARKT